ncbi:hypothetical protein, partial [uncultured Campylobacter sp.]|uniref:hypothetical protein n=1 Tax=uncultured Campylobacter sp. TaxID=218934 RepID=UPI0026247196
PIQDELDERFKGSGNKELLAFLMENKATYEGIYETAVNQPKFFTDLGEVGNALKNKDTKMQELLNMLTDKNGTNNTLKRPIKMQKHFRHSCITLNFTLRPIRTYNNWAAMTV